MYLGKPEIRGKTLNSKVVIGYYIGHDEISVNLLQNRKILVKD